MSKWWILAMLLIPGLVEAQECADVDLGQPNPTVEQRIVHLLHHIDQEAATSDASQITGVAARAQTIRNELAQFRGDNRVLSRANFLRLLKQDIQDTRVLAILTGINETERTQNINGELQTWVGKDRAMRPQ